MYLAANLASSHLPLFAQTIPPASAERLSWGVEAMDLFDRPIGAAHPVDIADAAPDATRPRDVLLAAPPLNSGGYYDWVDRMIAFRNAAAVNPAGLNLNGAEAADDTASADAGNAGDAAEASGSNAPGTTGSAPTEDGTASNGNGAGNASNNGAGSNGSLFGWLWGG